VDGFTLREVARRAGVSHAAPYHHFEDKTALVIALAQEAFERLTTQLREAAKERGSSVKKLEAVGIAYVEFALANQAEFRFMFRQELSLVLCQDSVERANQDAFQVLVDTLESCQQAGLLRDVPIAETALAAWSLVHGLAEILIADPSRVLLQSGPSTERIARTVIQVLERGLLRAT
jgi:AcrR family transcriptional regulator